MKIGCFLLISWIGVFRERAKTIIANDPNRGTNPSTPNIHNGPQGTEETLRSKVKAIDWFVTLLSTQWHHLFGLSAVVKFLLGRCVLWTGVCGSTCHVTFASSCANERLDTSDKTDVDTRAGFTKLPLWISGHQILCGPYVHSAKNALFTNGMASYAYISDLLGAKFQMWSKVLLKSWKIMISIVNETERCHDC